MYLITEPRGSHVEWSIYVLGHVNPLNPHPCYQILVINREMCAYLSARRGSCSLAITRCRPIGDKDGASCSITRVCIQTLHSIVQGQIFAVIIGGPRLPGWFSVDSRCDANPGCRKGRCSWFLVWHEGYSLGAKTITPHYNLPVFNFGGDHTTLLEETPKSQLHPALSTSGLSIQISPLELLILDLSIRPLPISRE